MYAYNIGELLHNTAMNKLRGLLKYDATLADLEKMLAEHPEIKKYFDGIATNHKYRYRTSLASLYSDEIVKTLLPPLKSGPKQYFGPYASCGGPIRDLIVETIGSLNVETPEQAGELADKIVKYYSSNASSAAMGLAAFRQGLMVQHNVDPDQAKTNKIIAETYKPDITRAHNMKAGPRLEARALEGLNVPEPYQKIESLVDRAKEFIKNHRDPTPQNAADFLVIFSARPGEIEIMDLGERGAIVGVLKKRGMDIGKQYNIVSAIGIELAQEYMTAWKETNTTLRRLAVVGLKKLVIDWGIQRRDLRAIGAALAVKAEMLSGHVSNVQQQRDVHHAALRHAKGKATAQQHYERVNDPLTQLYAQMSESSPEQLEAIRAILAKRA